MTRQSFALLSALIEDRIGLSYAPGDEDLFEGKIAARVFDLGFENALDYYYYLRYDDGDGSELAALTDALVVNETFFFREYAQVDTVLSKVVVPLIKAGKRPRIWSAACATGEEPATIAMWLADRGLLDAVELIASDVSGAALAIAREGRYRARSLRQIPPGVEPSRWIETDDNSLVVRPAIRAAIHWQRINLLDAAAVRELGEMDVVLCRNVLIYFQEDVVRRVVRVLAERLHPQGVLVVGVAESLMRFGMPLQCHELDGVFVYRKGAES